MYEVVTGRASRTKVNKRKVVVGRTQQSVLAAAAHAQQLPPQYVPSFLPSQPAAADQPLATGRLLTYPDITPALSGRQAEVRRTAPAWHGPAPAQGRTSCGPAQPRAHAARLPGAALPLAHSSSGRTMASGTWWRLSRWTCLPGLPSAWAGAAPPPGVGRRRSTSDATSHVAARHAVPAGSTMPPGRLRRSSWRSACGTTTCRSSSAGGIGQACKGSAPLVLAHRVGDVVDGLCAATGVSSIQPPRLLGFHTCFDFCSC